MKTSSHTSKLIAMVMLAFSVLISSAVVAADPVTKPLHSSTIISGDAATSKGSLLHQIKESLRLPKNLPSNSIYVHLYVNRDGELKVLEVYTASTELKDWITSEIENNKYDVTPSERGRHFEFTVSFRTA